MYPRCSDCPGSFHFRQSSGTVFKMIPYYGKHFTQPPSSQFGTISWLQRPMFDCQGAATGWHFVYPIFGL